MANIKTPEQVEQEIEIQARAINRAKNLQDDNQDLAEKISKETRHQNLRQQWRGVLFLAAILAALGLLGKVMVALGY